MPCYVCAHTISAPRLANQRLAAQEIGVKTPVAPASPPAPASPKRAAVPRPSRLGQAAVAAADAPCNATATEVPADAASAAINPETANEPDADVSEEDGAAADAAAAIVNEGSVVACSSEGDEGDGEGFEDGFKGEGFEGMLEGGARVRHECTICGITTTSAAHLEVPASSANLHTQTTKHGGLLLGHLVSPPCLELGFQQPLLCCFISSCS